MNPTPALALIMAFTLGASGLAAQEGRGFPLTLEDAAGRSLSLPSPPQRIISLSPAVTEILFAIGAGDRVVGRTEYCNYPPEASSVLTVGGFSGITVNLELTASLKPDLVILSAFMHERLFPLLGRLSIPNFAVEPRTFAEVYRTIETLGALTGTGEAARGVVAQMRAKIAQAEARRGSRERPGVFWELSDEPLMTAGGGTFITEAIRLGGGRNIFEDLRMEWPTVSGEQVLLRRPDWIIAGDDHGRSIEPAQLARRPGWQGLPAVREGRVATVGADSLYRYGPRLADAVLAISAILHGE